MSKPKTKTEEKTETKKKTFEVVLVRRVEYRTSCEITLDAADDDAAQKLIEAALGTGDFVPEDTTSGHQTVHDDPEGWEVDTSEVTEDGESWEVEEISELEV